MLEAKRWKGCEKDKILRKYGLWCSFNIFIDVLEFLFFWVYGGILMMLYEGPRWLCWNLGLVSDARIHKSNPWLKTSWDSRIEHTIVIKFLVYVFLGKVWFSEPFPKSYDVFECSSWKTFLKSWFACLSKKSCVCHILTIDLGIDH